MKLDFERWAQEDMDKLLDLIPFFHGFYARTKNPEALEIAKNIGIAVNNLSKETKSALT